jgi:hypothetical protein
MLAPAMRAGVGGRPDSSGVAWPCVGKRGPWDGGSRAGRCWRRREMAEW